MRRSILLLVAVTFALCSCRHGDERLLGQWASVDRAQGQVATVIEFRPKGSLISSWQSLMEFKYQLGNNMLLLSTSDTKTHEPTEQSFELALTAGSMTLTNLTDNSQEHFARVGTAPSGDSSVIGQWQSSGTGNEPVYMNFRSDGTMSLRRVVRSNTGTYEVSGDSLVITLPGGPPQKGTYRFDGDELVLTPEGGKEIRYKRLT